MKRTFSLVFTLSLFLSTGSVVQSQPRIIGPWHMYGQGHHYGKYHRGPAECWRIPHSRYMGPAYCYPYYGWPGYGPDRTAFGSTLSKGEAKKLVQWMIRCDPSLEVGDIDKVDEGYEVAVVTRKGNKLVDTLFVEKDTAYVYPIYKPAEE